MKSSPQIKQINIPADGKASIRCPNCSTQDNHTTDTRTSKQGDYIRRRRECNVCLKRFTTRERAIERSKIADTIAMEAIEEIKAVIKRLHERLTELDKDNFEDLSP